MAVFDLYSKRQKMLRGEVPDVYTYDEIPQALRVQIAQIIHATLGNHTQYFDTYTDSVKKTYQQIVEILCREYGVFSLCQTYGNRDYHEELTDFLVNEQDVERILDVTELSFKAIEHCTRTHGYLFRSNYNKIADEAINELNTRFKEHGVGYHFEKQIIKIDNQLIHHEAVKPALQLLAAPSYSGPQEEFLSAFEHYRHGNHKEALTDALKSLESTMKVICITQGWKFNPNDTAKKLLDICYNQGLIPSFWQNHMTGLRAVLEGGVPTARNKLGGHGQGETPVEVPEHIVSYVLHMTASTIVFLVKAEQAL
ncbi:MULTISPECIES: STM4504/CBY_0614 family protein [unclassified Maridesulfovibrio]|uniref:STM4504/CBY_0614 family protein n=1 Tax=unclassified Maridesulfovibrio TaxID=2794999 RepID=UPI003B3C2CD6